MLVSKLFKQIAAISLSAGSSVVLQGTTLLLTIFIANYFGPAGLSKFSVTQNIALTIAAICPFGLGYTSLNFIAKARMTKSDETAEIAGFCLTLTALIATVASIFLMVFAKPLASYIYGNENLYFFILAASFAILPASLSLVQQSTLNGLQLYSTILTQSVFYLLIVAAFTLIGATYWGLPGVAIGFVLSLVIRAFCMQWSLSARFPTPLKFPSIDIWRKVRSFAVPAGLAGLTLTPAIWFSNAWLIKHSGLEVQGMVLAALVIRTAIAFVPQQMSNVFLPQYLSTKHENRNQHFKQMASYAASIIIVTISLCALSYVYRENIFKIFGEGFNIDESVFIALLLSNIIESICIPFSFYYTKKEKMWSFLFKYTYPKDISLIILSLVLIPINGGLGLAAAYLISFSIGFIILSFSLLYSLYRGYA